MKIAIIGGGNMGTLIAKALNEKFRVTVSERDPLKHAKFSELEIDVTDSNIHACEDADVVILAVKPQDFSALDICGHLQGDAVVISIMAGVGIDKIRDVLGGHKFIARVMPNLPAFISEGISGFCAPDLNTDQKVLVHDILSALGEVVEVENEDDIDKVTAISGSGPAYVFYFIKALSDAGTGLGLPFETAHKLALKTVFGASKYAFLDTSSLEDLIKRVASKGGTTEKALQVFDDRAFTKIIDEAAKAAYKRAKELSD